MASTEPLLEGGVHVNSNARSYIVLVYVTYMDGHIMWKLNVALKREIIDLFFVS